LKHRLS